MRLHKVQRTRGAGYRDVACNPVGVAPAHLISCDGGNAGGCWEQPLTCASRRRCICAQCSPNNKGQLEWPFSYLMHLVSVSVLTK